MLLLAINICFHHVLTKKKCWHLLLSEKKFDIKVTARLILLLICWFFFLSKASFWFLAWIIKRIVMKTYCCIKESERSFLTLEKRQFFPSEHFFSPYLKVFLWYQKRRRPPSFMSSFHRRRCTILPLGLLDGCHPIENTFFYRSSCLE